jgi:cytochrome c biogenesis protein CcmG/thiol:disulfide interchange protein DsbE
MRKAQALLASAAASAVLVAGCGTATPAGDANGADNIAGAQPVARHPVLSPCPSSGMASALPSLSLGCLGTGPVVNLAALGGPVLVNLWASWCGPCRKEMPSLQAAFDSHGAKIQFLGVDTEDDRNSANDFLAAFGVHYPQVSDARGDLLHQIGGSGLPVTLILDRTGKVVYSKRGEMKHADLTAALRAAGIS